VPWYSAWIGKIRNVLMIYGDASPSATVTFRLDKTNRPGRHTPSGPFSISVGTREISYYRHLIVVF
jgi:hypothetical protein